MNKKCKPLKNVKLDEAQTTKATFVITDEMKTAFHEVASETAEEYAKRIPEPKTVRPNVTIQCDGTACKSVRDDVGETKTDINTIKSKINRIDGSLKTISKNLNERPYMKCVPKELSGFYFRGHHITAGHIFGAFAWLVFVLLLLTIDSYLKVICENHPLSTKMKKFLTPENYYENCFGIMRMENEPVEKIRIRAFYPELLLSAKTF